MVSPTFIQCAESIIEACPTRFHLHEGYFSQILEFEEQKHLNNFILRIENGGSGSKQDGTWKSNPSPLNVAINLKDNSTDNVFGLHYDVRGKKSKPNGAVGPSPNVLNQKGRWFCMGKFNQSSNLVSLVRQIELIRYAIGTHRVLDRYPVIKARRLELWKHFVTGDHKGKDYGLIDLPVLVEHFPAFFETPIEWESESDGALSERSVSGLRIELRHLLRQVR